MKTLYTSLFILFITSIGYTQVTISGTISDSNETLLGVNILEKGTSNGTTSVTLTNGVAIEKVS